MKSIPPSKIEAWVAKHFEYKKRENGELILANPFYHNDKMKFNISLTKACCHDWRGDEWAGPVNPETNKRNCSIVKFVREYLNCSYREALSELLGATEDVSAYLKPEGRISAIETQKKAAVALPNGVELIATSKNAQASALRKWLNVRGYTTEHIEKAELYHLGMDVYWPYFEFEMLVYWQARSRMNKRFEFPNEHVYNNKEEIIGKIDGTKGDFFYGFDDIEPASYVIITEAIFDQNTLGEQALASGGASLTKNQCKKLKIIGPRKGIILSPDNDDAGISSIIKNSQMLRQIGFTVFYSIPPKLKYCEDGVKYTKDWNEMLVKLKLTQSEVRSIHDNRIKKIMPSNIINLYERNKFEHKT